MGHRQGAVEVLDMMLFSDCYRDRRVLITGHTGFKGSWLALWLNTLGAKVIGVSLAPETSPNHWSLLGLPVNDERHDIRDAAAIGGAIAAAQPEIVFHLAAQSLVRRSYRDPLDTWSTNVMGTAHVLEACRRTPSVRAVVVVTTDKCYENREWQWGYREIDRLGGSDPYGASKAGAELVAASYRSAFFGAPGVPLLATARAGNVIGGGDWSEDRLIPDLVRALQASQSLEVRSPAGTRPWQHVLESLSGYLLLGHRLLGGDRSFSEPWNFGPAQEGHLPVGELLARLAQGWPGIRWHVSDRPQPREALLLYLDSSKARSKLNWRPVWSFEDTLTATIEWYRAWLERGEVISRRQLEAYVAAAAQRGIQWAQP